MSVLTMCTSLALNVGMEVPDRIVSSPRREWREAATMLEETGEELARRVDWGELTRTATLTGAATYDLPDDFSRLVSGICVRAGGKPVRPVDRAEWGYLPDDATGTPRYFLLTGDRLHLWPGSSDVVEIVYQSRNWRVSGAEAWDGDGDGSVIDEDLMTLGLIVRWRRKHGMPFEDEEAEYEAAIRQVAQFDGRSRL